MSADSTVAELAQRTELVGVGVELMPSRLDAFRHVRDLVDLVEVVPESLGHVAAGRSGGERATLAPKLTDEVLESIGELPVVTRGCDLSIGSAEGWNPLAVELLEGFDRRRESLWHTEPVSFSAAGAPGAERCYAGVPLPLPQTTEAVALVGERAAALRPILGRTVLLENIAWYLPGVPAEDGWDEARFFTELCNHSGCGMTLDLPALQCNCRNTGRDVWDLIERLPFDSIREIHVAGCDSLLGHSLDSENQVVATETWEIAEHVLERAPRAAALVVQLEESSFERIGFARYRADIARARELWDRHAVSRNRLHAHSRDMEVAS